MSDGKSKTAIRIVFRTLGVALAVLVLFFAWTSALWTAPVLVVWFLAIAAALLFPASRNRLRLVRRVLVGFALLWTITFTILWRVPFEEIETRMAVLHETSFADPQTLSILDRLAIYHGNLAMGLVGYAACLPEIAWETTRMAWPGPERHVIESDFAMGSAKVRDEVAAFARSLPERSSSPRDKTTRIAWSGGYADYWSYAGQIWSEARVALAVNCPFVLEMNATWDDNEWRIDCRGSCDVAYGRFREMTPMFRVGDETAYFSETMFWALQELGWMHPFVVTYIWSVKSDDGRLRSR